jgi:hypothetical protein
MTRKKIRQKNLQAEVSGRTAEDDKDYDKD